jgi:hypothetical protein
MSTFIKLIRWKLWLSCTTCIFYYIATCAQNVNLRPVLPWLCVVVCSVIQHCKYINIFHHSASLIASNSVDDCDRYRSYKVVI